MVLATIWMWVSVGVSPRPRGCSTSSLGIIVVADLSPVHIIFIHVAIFFSVKICFCVLMRRIDFDSLVGGVCNRKQSTAVCLSVERGVVLLRVTRYHGLLPRTLRSHANRAASEPEIRVWLELVEVRMWTFLSFACTCIH